MGRDEEMNLVQTFVDMAGIERLAGGMFAVQRDRVEDSTLAAIYDCFVADEERHAQVAERLAQHYNVHQYREYRVNPNLLRFTPRLIDTARNFSAEVANIYITAGELMLDVALLRALDDACDDPTCSDAMRRINRDESRHVAIDFHMLHRYANSPETRTGSMLNPRGYYHFARMIAAARPFIRDVVIEPMDRCDPSGKRIREVIKRVQIAVRAPGVAQRPFPRLLRACQWLANQPVLGAMLQPLITAVIGVDARAFEPLFSPADLETNHRGARN